MTRRRATLPRPSVLVALIAGGREQTRRERGRTRGRRPGAGTVVVLAVVFALTAGACGPERPFELGLKEVPSDLLLGRQTKPVQALPALLPPATTLFTETLTPTPQTPTTLPPPIPLPPEPPPACPAANPLAPARLPVTTDVPMPPAPAEYRFRTEGSVVIAGQPQPVEPTATHTVLAAGPAAPGEFFFDVAVSHNGAATITTYHVVPRTSAASAQAPGLYISRVFRPAPLPGGTDDEFVPKPELLVLPFPALPGITFTAAGSDGVTTISYDGVVEPTQRIDACGTMLDTIPVKLTNGRAVSGRPEEGRFLAEEFTAAYNFATQYGGLIVKHELKGVNAGGVAPFSRELRGVITSEPKEAGP